jgi:hypothetical protein
MMNLPTILKATGNLLHQNSSHILTGLAVAGVISTTVLAVKATPESNLLVADLTAGSGNWDEEPPRWEKVKAGYKPYIPAAFTGIATIGCIIGAQSINVRRQAAMVGLYSVTDAAFREYKEKVVATLGEKEHEKVRQAVVQDRMAANPVSTKEIIVTNGGDVQCFDTHSGRYFTSNHQAIRTVQNDIRDEIHNSSYASLNHYYVLLGIGGLPYGDDTGWNHDNQFELHIDTMLGEDDKPCITVDFRNEPEPSFVAFH